MMTNHRPICLVAAAFNILIYLYIFFNELPGNASGGNGMATVNSTNPLAVVVPRSIFQSKIKVYVQKDFCPRPIVRVRLVGPEIRVFPPLAPPSDPDDSSPAVHELEVDVRESSLLAGVYYVEASVMRCHDGGEGTAAATTDDATISCVAGSEWENAFDIGSADGNNWAWVNVPECESQLGGGRRSPECAEPGGRPNQRDYVFLEIDRETKVPQYDNLVTLKDGATALSKPTSLLTPTDGSSSLLKYFSELSNYELVCWLGDDDARKYWRAFMDLFPLMGPHGQRPFKFKYVRLTDATDPTLDFSDATHMTYEKCKMFFVSYGVGRFEAGVSPEAYGEEVETLLGHVEKSHPDGTYPVWFLSPRSSASTPDGTSCRVGNSEHRGRTPDRIRDFAERARRALDDRRSAARPSEPRVRLMDNLDVTEAFWRVPSTGRDESGVADSTETRVTATVAMRCMEEIARGVEAWRSAGQIGTQHGLLKNGTLIPNDELFRERYKWGK